ncbi:hypothetical protein D9M68_806010 [compost metagenome]
MFGQRRAGEHGQHLAPGDLLAQVGRHRLRHARDARHHVRGAVVVEADLAGKVDAAAQRGGACRGDADTGLLHLLRRQLDDMGLVGGLRRRSGGSGSAGRGTCRLVVRVAVVMAGMLALFSVFAMLMPGLARPAALAREQDRRAAQQPCDQDGHHRGPLLLAHCHA